MTLNAHLSQHHQDSLNSTLTTELHAETGSLDYASTLFVENTDVTSQKEANVAKDSQQRDGPSNRTSTSTPSEKTVFDDFDTTPLTRTPVATMASHIFPMASSSTSLGSTTTETPWKRVADGLLESDDQDRLKYFLLFAFIAPLLLFVVAMLLYLYYKLRRIYVARKRAKAQRRKKERESKVPREVEPEKLDMALFKDKGPLVMNTSYSGDVKHALQDIRSMSLHTLVFDAAQNSLVNIGTEVEKIVGRTEDTQKSASLTCKSFTCKSVSERTKTSTGSGENASAEPPRWFPDTEDENLTTCITASLSKTGSSELGSGEKIGSGEKLRTLSSENVTKSSMKAIDPKRRKSTTSITSKISPSTSVEYTRHIP